MNRETAVRHGTTASRPSNEEPLIRSVEEFVTTVRTDSAGWPVEQPRWFRGEPATTSTPLVSSLYRTNSGSARENQLAADIPCSRSGIFPGRTA